MLGGHGYSSFSRLGRIYTDNDVNLTWEGDNNMLLQQTSKFLLKVLQSKKICQLTDISFF
jgi:acyl-CoA oxidase